MPTKKINIGGFFVHLLLTAKCNNVIMKLIKCVLRNSVVHRKVDTTKAVSEVKYRF